MSQLDLPISLEVDVFLFRPEPKILLSQNGALSSLMPTSGAIGTAATTNKPDVPHIS